MSRSALLALSFLEDFDGNVRGALFDVPLHHLSTSLLSHVLYPTSYLYDFYGLWHDFTMALTNGVSRTSCLFDVHLTPHFGVPLKLLSHDLVWNLLWNDT